MDTKTGWISGRGPRRCKTSRAVFAALVSAGVICAQPVSAKEPAKAGADPKAAQPAAVQPLRGPNCRGEVREGSNVAVAVGKSTLVSLDEPTIARTIGNPVVAQATLVSPRTLYIVGMSVGTTNMIIQGRSGTCQMMNVIVGVDADGLQHTLRQLLPAERGIRVTTAAGNLVLSGDVSSAPAAQQAMQIANAYAASQPTQQSQSSSSSAGGSSSTQQVSSSGGSTGVLNMMTVDSPQQVMLEVKVAEVAKTVVNQLGSALNLQGGFGSWTGALVSSLLTGAQTAIAASKANRLPFQAAIDAQKTDQLTKILAEPNLVTVSGQEASFLAGGRVFIPVPQSNSNGGTTITLQEEEFGVGLKFTPTVLANGRINLKVSPEVSELSPTGVTVSAAGTSSTAILPLITTRRAATTVQMNDGESFAIGGLIGNNITGALKALPGLGEVPVIGALLRSTNFQQDRTELVFIITPHLVKPLANPNVALPTDSFTQPNEADIYATGNMEGRGAKPRTAPAAAPGASNTPASPATQSLAAPTGSTTPPSVPPSSSATQPPAAIAPGETESTSSAPSPAPAVSEPVPTADVTAAVLPRSDSGAPAPQPAPTSSSTPAPAAQSPGKDAAGIANEAASQGATAARGELAMTKETNDSAKQ
ncbi:type II and III secretion system protein family protein [Trinickia soli]|uniref:Secretin n=1 Tax=Trinickia soli TaxID=380675 RepID=A0A2N7WG91_9BURK|nr:type II and III secretion system protein family protein [Trinickia soli]PMS28383.1 secretin [Trinickia soli]CAB3668722.1 Type 3 secretion system secretin [Trinickia soli]